MSRRVHYAVEVLYDTLSQPLCENQAGRDAFRGPKVELTSYDEEVTCRRCLKALGYAVPTADILSLEPKELPNGRFQVAA